MYTIKVLVSTLPSYASILDKYNDIKPLDWAPIRKASVYEGGFEVPLHGEELRLLREKYPDSLLDQNDYVRQLRWSNGALKSFGYIPLKDEETLMLGKALVSVLGVDNVKIIDNTEIVDKDQIVDNTKIIDNTEIVDKAQIVDNAKIIDNVNIYKNYV
jgi:hypothetical protein